VSGPHATNANIKPLRKGWEWIPLGKYVENHDGRRIPISKKERESRSGLFPYYGASGVIDTIDGFTHDGEFLLIGEDGANLLTRSKPLAFLTKGKVWVNNHAHVLRCKPGYSNAYLAYFINSIDLSEYVTGTAQPKLSQSMMNKILIPVAPPEQQVEIVAELEKQFSRLDEAVANLQRVKANLKRYKASVLKDAVEGRLVPTEAELSRREGRSFETGEQLLQRVLEVRRSQWQGKGKYKEPIAQDTGEMFALPDGWAAASVEQLTSLVEYGSSAKTNEDSTGVPVLRMGNIVNGEFLFDVLKYLPQDHNEFPKLFVEPGDVLFNRTNSPELVGKTAVFKGALQPHSYASYLIRMRVVQGYVPVFLAAFINSTHGREWVKKVVTQQVGQANVNGTKLQALVVPLPPSDEQIRIVAELERRVSLVRSVESEVDANLKRAQALRQATLAKAFAVN
jgi:type I restriction enzyme, S subunit